jgi:hypothetical protein
MGIECEKVDNQVFHSTWYPYLDLIENSNYYKILYFKSCTILDILSTPLSIAAWPKA